MESLESWRSTSIISGMLPMNVLVLDAGSSTLESQMSALRGRSAALTLGNTHLFIPTDEELLIAHDTVCCCLEKADSANAERSQKVEQLRM